MAKNYSKTIANSVGTFLKEDNWRHDFDEENGIFNTSIQLGCKIKTVRYIIDIRQNDYIVYVYSPIGPNSNDKEAMLRAAEFLTRANYSLVLGNFEIDMRDGEIRYKVCVLCDGDTLSQRVIRRSMYVPAVMLERYGNGLLNVLYSDISPQKAYEQCENNPDDADTDEPQEADDDEQQNEDDDSTEAILAKLTARLASIADGE